MTAMIVPTAAIGPSMRPMSLLGLVGSAASLTSRPSTTEDGVQGVRPESRVENKPRPSPHKRTIRPPVQRETESLPPAEDGGVHRGSAEDGGCESDVPHSRGEHVDWEQIPGGVGDEP